MLKSLSFICTCSYLLESLFLSPVLETLVLREPGCSGLMKLKTMAWSTSDWTLLMMTKWMWMWKMRWMEALWTILMWNAYGTAFLETMLG